VLISVEFKPKVYKNRYECPECKRTGCFQHCNHCGKDIRWKDEQGDARYENRKRMLFNPDFSIHRCMTKGTKDGQFYDSTFNEQDWKAEIRKYNYCQQHFMCMICAREYNQEVYPRCPSCFKKVCRRCGNQQSYIFRSAADLNKCYKCGHDKLDLQQVYYSYMRLYGN